MAVPTRDSKLVPWSTTFNDLLVADGVTVYHRTAPEVSGYTALHTPYIAAAAAAADAAQRNKSLVAARNSKKALLIPYARNLYAQIQADPTVSNEAKVDAGIKIKDFIPTPGPIPGTAPVLSTIGCVGRTVTLRLKDALDLERRGRAPGTAGAQVYAYVGASAPTDNDQWKFMGATGKTIAKVTFPDSVPGGALVWFTAVWFNGSKQTGPQANAVSTNLQGGAALAG